MAGVKGRSGRRPRSIEQKRLDIIDKAWESIDEYFDSNAKLKDKVDIAIKVAVKDMPADMVLDQSEHTHFTFKWKGKPKNDNSRNRDKLLST